MNTATNQTQRQTYVLYNANCMDGMAAAFAAWLALGDKGVTYIPVHYNSAVPIMDDDSNVYILDFSYKRQQILDLKSRMDRVVVLDHHITAQEELKDIDGCSFTMEHSGAMMAWVYFTGFNKGNLIDPNKSPEAFVKMTINDDIIHVPKVILNIEDRDLWKWQYQETKYVTKALQVLVTNFKDLHKYANNISTYRELISIGQQKDYFDGIEIEESIYKAAIVNLDGLTIAFGNITDHISEVGQEWCKTYDVDFSMSYFIIKEGKVIFSLRSLKDKKPESFDVSEFAKKFGGGGNRNAAGISLNIQEGLNLIGELLKNKAV